MTSTKTISVNAEELRTTFEFVSFGAPLEHSAYICVDTGKIYCHSVSAGLEKEEDLREDLETSDRYIAVPHKNDLGVAREPHTAEKSSVSRRLRRLTRGYSRAFWPGRGDQRLKCLGGSDDRLWRFTPGSRDAALPLHRPHLSPGLRTQTSGGGGRMHVSSLAAAISDSFISRLWQNWRRLCQGRVPFCRSPSYPGGSFQKGREERRHRAAASRRRGAARKGPRRAHRGGTREGVDLEIVAAEGTGEGGPPAHGLGTRAGLC